MKRIILHLDMNSYFASVEQQANPFLRNKPIGVCAYISKNGCLIATSKEAKKFGVITGLRVREALKLCPNLILLENDPNKYRSVSERFFKLMAQYGEDLEIYSIDEGFLDLTGSLLINGQISAESYKKAANIALEIQARIKNEIGDWLSCSVGISYTKFLAKFASDTALKGFTHIINDEASLNSAYKGRLVEEAWGIGPALSKALNKLGIKTILELKSYSPFKLLTHFGKSGYFLWARINGLELDDLVCGKRGYAVKSIGHSYCLTKPTKDKRYLEEVFSKLLFKIASHLRETKQVARGIRVFWSYSDFAEHGYNGKSAHFSRSNTMYKDIFLFNDLFTFVHGIIQKEALNGYVLMIGVSVFNLLPYSMQATIFNSCALARDSIKEDIIEKLNNRFGDLTIYPGILFSVKNSAPDRIGFRKSIRI